MAAGVLDGKVAIVTGASRGIGAAIAQTFAAAGAAVAAAARTASPEDSPLPGTIHDTVDAIHAAGGTAVAIPTNLARPEERERLVAEAESQLGPVDILVNDAAVTYYATIGAFDLRRMQLMLEVQVKAPLHLAQLVLPGMRERHSGWICNISSGAARHPQSPPPEGAESPTGTVYGMCKAALERFTTGLATEVYPYGVAVNALSPNQVVVTPGVVFLGLRSADDVGRVGEPPEVMANAALALCSGPPTLTGRITYSQDLLTELGR